MKPISITLAHVKETKGTHVYGTDAEDAAVTTLYIKKSALPADAPQTLTLTLAEPK